MPITFLCSLPSVLERWCIHLSTHVGDGVKGDLVPYPRLPDSESMWKLRHELKMPPLAQQCLLSRPISPQVHGLSSQRQPFWTVLSSTKGPRITHTQVMNFLPLLGSFLPPMSHQVPLILGPYVDVPFPRNFTPPLGSRVSASRLLSEGPTGPHASPR